MSISLIDLASYVVMGLACSFIIADMIGNKRLPVIAIILMLFVGGAFAIELFAKPEYNKYLANIKNIDRYYQIASLVVLLVGFTSYLVHTHQGKKELRLLKAGASYTESNFVAYVSKSNQLLSVSKKLEEVFKRKSEQTKLKEFNLKSVLVNGEEIQFKKLERIIASCNNTIDEVVHFKFVYSNSLEIELNMIKKAVYNKKRKIGYVLLDNTVPNSYKAKVNAEFKRNLYIYLDLFQDMIAHFDSEDQIYVLSHTLMESLELSSNRMDPTSFKHLIHPDDLESFEKKASEENKIHRIYFRMKINQDYLWFEESSAVLLESNFTLIKRVDIATGSRVVFGHYKGFVKHVTKLCEEKKPFGVIMLSMSNLLKATANKGKDFTEILTSKYFAKLLNGVLKEHTSVYKIGSIEYAFVVESEEYLRLVIRELKNNTSEIMTQEVVVNKMKYRLECELGIVSSHSFDPLDPRALIKASFDALKEATDPDYLRNYSIFQPKDEVQLEYSLEDLGINLDEDLSSFEDELKE